MDRSKSGAKALKLDLNSGKPVKKLKAVPMTYKDYMVREEAQKSAKGSMSQSQMFNSGLSVGSHRQSHGTSHDSGPLKPKIKSKPVTTVPTKVLNLDMRKKKPKTSPQRPTSIEIKREIQVVYDNFMQRLQDGEVEDDDSLLQES